MRFGSQSVERQKNSNPANCTETEHRTAIMSKYVGGQHITEFTGNPPYSVPPYSLRASD